MAEGGRKQAWSRSRVGRSRWRERSQDRWRTQVGEFLGDVALWVLPGHAKANPRTLAGVIFLLVAAPQRFVAITDSAHWVLRRKRFTGKPKGPVVRLPQRLLGPFEARWLRLQLGNEDIWIERGYSNSYVDAINQSLPAWAQRWRHPPLTTRGAAASWFYLILGLVTMSLGAAEIGAGSTQLQWYGGIAFVLAGALLVSASIVLSRGDWSDEWGRVIGFPAGFAAILLGSYLFIVSLQYKRDGRLIVWLLWIALAVVAIRRLPPQPPVQETADHKRSRSIVQALASVGVGISFIWSLVQLWSTARYSTSVLGPTLSVSAVVVRAPELDGNGQRGFTAKI